MKIIDFEKKGNVVRFYLGENTCDDYWGDDWNDYPYECNAERVSSECVKAVMDVMFPFDWEIMEPCDGVNDSGVSKEDMKNRKVPCIIAVPPAETDSWGFESFSKYIGKANVSRFYFGDIVTDVGQMSDLHKQGVHINYERLSKHPS